MIIASGVEYESLDFADNHGKFLRLVFNSIGIIVPLSPNKKLYDTNIIQPYDHNPSYT